MSATSSVSGKDGRLYWGYHEAAVVNTWRVDGDARSLSMTATLLTANPLQLSQRPLVFAATLPKGVWRFPVVTLQIMGASLTATLGPKE